MRYRLCTGMFAVAGLATSALACPPACNAGQNDCTPATRVIETQANTFTRFSQTHAALDADADGNVFIAWASKRQELGSWGIFAQRFDPLGRRIGTEIHVNSTIPGTQWRPDVAVTPDGTTWVAWESQFQGGVEGGIVLRRFDGENVSDEIVVNEATDLRHEDPVLAIGDDGSVLVSWSSRGENSCRVMARLYGADGQPLTSAFKIVEPGDGQDSNAAVASFGDGYVVAWGHTDAAGVPRGVHARLLDAKAHPAATTISVAGVSQDGHAAIEPSIARDDAGRFVITWMSERDGGYAVQAARFARDGSVLDRAWTVAEADGIWNNGAAVAVADDGRFVVSYNRIEPVRPQPNPEVGMNGQRTPHPSAVWAQAYDADASPIGSAYRVNQIDDATQELSADRGSRRVIWTDLDQLAFAWSGRIGDDKKVGVGLTMYVPSDLDAPAPKPVEQVAAAQDLNPTDLTPPEPNPEGPSEDRFVTRDGPDFGFQGFGATEWTPPDCDIAVGPNNIVVTVNMMIRYFSKDGTLQFEQDLRGSGGFFGSVGGTSFMFDPVCLYDAHSQRFIVGCASGNGNTEALFVAISDDSDPNGSWNMYRHLTGSQGGFPDFPNLGVDADAIYWTNDFFSSPVGNWVTIIDKQDLINGVTPTVKKLKLFNDISSVGNTKTFDANAPAQYLATSFQSSDTQIRLIAIQNGLTAPTATHYLLTVPGYSQPSDAPQQGSSSRVSTVDQRIKNAVYRNGSLWISHGVRPSGQTETMVRWYQVAMNGWPDSGSNPTLVQSGDIDLGNGVYTWFPDIMVDDAGNAGLMFNRSSSSEYVGVARAIRRAGDALGTFRPAVTMQTSTSADTSGRWGDYSGVDNDPDCVGMLWGQVEYRTSGWRTWVGSTWFAHIADHNGDGVIDSQDFIAFLNDFTAGNAAADVNNDGHVDSQDFIAFLNAFVNPCG